MFGWRLWYVLYFLFNTINNFLGANYTKIGIFVVNAKNPNNPSNVSLLSIFNADDSQENLNAALSRLATLFPLPSVLEFNNKKYNIVTFVTGDVKFLSALYGTSGAASNFPCLNCLSGKATKEPLKWKTEHFSERNLKVFLSWLFIESYF